MVITDSRANSLTVSGSLLVSVGAARNIPIATIAINRLAFQVQLDFITNYETNVVHASAPILKSTGARVQP